MDSEILPLVDFKKVFKKKKVIKEESKSKEPEKAPESQEQTADLSKIVLEKKKVDKKENEEIQPEITEEYKYDELLERVYNLIKNHNPELSSERQVIKIPPPSIIVYSRTRSAWMNFISFVNGLNRPIEHLKDFVSGELGVDCSIGGENQLFLKTKITKNQIEKIIIKYIQDYVKCPNCKSFKTIIKKDQSTRLHQIYCESCKTEKSIQTIKSSAKAGKNN